VAYALFIFSGIVIFNFFSEMAFRSPMLLHEYAHYIKQTIFPSDMLAVISTLRATAYTGISVVVMLIFQLLVTHSLPWTVLLIPLVFLPLMGFLVGMAWFLCAVGAFTRDAGYLMINIVPLFMFATPVFYPHSSLSSPFDILIYANALTGYVECMRDIVLQGHIPNPLVYLWMLATSVSTFYFGYWFFDRYRNVIVDVI
jgi:lipopolysaccharide transport system permease protein